MSSPALAPSPASIASRRPGTTYLVPAALGALGLLLVWRWAHVWTADPDYAHGWAVPLLAAYLAWERWADRPSARPVHAPSTPRPADPRTAVSAWFRLFVCLGGAVAFVALRLLLEPFPRWPMALWLFSALGLGLVFALVRRAYGSPTARHFLVPLVFTATALPWPAVVDLQVIHPLREALAAIAGEVVNAWGYPAIVHGTVIEIGRGLVGVDEACSGVRSLQTAVMVAVFLGEFYRFTGARRFTLLAAGLALALATNIARTVFLSLQGAIAGPGGIDRWHDSAGNVQVVVCLGGLVLVAWWWSRNTPAPPAASPARAPARSAGTAPAADSPATPGVGDLVARPASAAAGMLLLLVVGAEAGTRAWFDRGERQQRATAGWTASLPKDNPSFQGDPFTPSMQRMLGCDAHELGRWSAHDGTARAGYILEWRQGQTARFAPTLHNPTVCLPMSGSVLVKELGPVSLAAPGGLALPLRGFVFQRGTETYHVFYLAWDLALGRPLTAGTATAEAGMSGWIGQQWADVRAARRHLAARVMTLAIYGARDADAATAAAQTELAAMIRTPTAP